MGKLIAFIFKLTHLHQWERLSGGGGLFMCVKCNKIKSIK